MNHIKAIKNKLLLLALASVSVVGLTSLVSAHHGGADPFHYSAWSSGEINFTVSGQGWSAHPQGIWTTNPDQARAYFCQEFGFFNCQVTGPTDTWVRSRGTCWTSAVGVGSSVLVTSAWSRTISSVSCPSDKPVLSSPQVQVASIPFVF